MRSRIIAGVNDSKTRRKVLAGNPPPTLQQTIDICQGNEAAFKNNEQLSQPRRARAVTQQEGQPTRPGDPRYDASDAETCRKCEWSAHRPEERCPAKGKECHLCRRLNHFAKMCRSGDLWGRRQTGRDDRKSPSRDDTGNQQFPSCIVDHKHV